MDRTRTELGELLRRSPWFARLSSSLQRALVSAGRVLTLRSDQWIYTEGDESDGIWTVLEGMVRLELAVGDEKRILVTLAGPGAFTGQLRRPNGHRRFISARASQPSVIFSVGGSALERVAARDPMLWKALVVLSHAQMSTALRIAAEALSMSPRARIASRLLRLHNHLPRGKLPLRQSEIAEMAGISRKSANYHLQVLRRLKAISLAYAGVEVLDRKKLEAIARD